MPQEFADNDRINAWLARFAEAAAGADVVALASLFTVDGQWRDLLVVSADFHTFAAAEFAERLSGAGLLPARFDRMVVSGSRMAPREVSVDGVDCLEAHIEFEVPGGRGEGVLRLVETPDGDRAWNLLTSLTELEGFPERIGRNRPTGVEDSRRFGGNHWTERREAEQKYLDRDPEVLIVGGGHSGLSLAARLGQLDVDCLVIDRHEEVGDNWRKRYSALTLHNSIWINDLPYMPFPATWQKYTPKDRLAEWFKAYVHALDINYWTSSSLEAASYDAADERWSVTIARGDGSVRTMRPRHLVLAIGLFGSPKRPDIPGLGSFKGEVLHAAEYLDGSTYRGRRALVLGTGNSGHDVAQDLHAWGAEVCLIQRGSTSVISVEPGIAHGDAVFQSGPIEDVDLVIAALPYPHLVRAQQAATAAAKQLDAELLASLEQVGFRLDFGPDESGAIMKYFRDGGGYYLNVGCSELIARGEIGLLHWEDVDQVVETGLRLKDSSVVPADLLVLATGYESLTQYLEKTLDAETAERVGPIWGFDEEGEWRNAWRPTAQEHLWLMVGNFQQARFYSRALALQIKAELAGRTLGTAAAHV